MTLILHGDIDVRTALAALWPMAKMPVLPWKWPEALAVPERLKARPSIARVLAEAGPWLKYFPAG